MRNERRTVPAAADPVIPLLPYQREDLESPARFRWNCWARQTGKSFVKSLRRIVRAVQRRRHQIFLSAGERQSRELMQKARAQCQALRMAADYHECCFGGLSIKQLEIRLPNRARIIGLPANPLTARGFTGDVLLDEFAMHEHDRAIWASLFPTILRGGGELDIASTPRGKNNMFYELAANPLFSKSFITLDDAIAQGLRVNREALRQAMGDETLFRQEFLCEFLDEAAAFLTFDQIAACADDGLKLCESVDALSHDPRELFVGVDVGRMRDLTVIWILSAEGDALVTTALFELDHCPFHKQMELLGEVLSLRRVRRCCIDAGGIGMQLAEQCADRFGSHRVEAVTFTAALKSQLAGALRIAVEAQRIRIPNDQRIRNDWHSVERTMTEAGHFRLVAPRSEGSHADRFWAAVLAVHAADQGSGKVEAFAVKPLQFAAEGVW